MILVSKLMFFDTVNLVMQTNLVCIRRPSWIFKMAA